MTLLHPTAHQGLPTWFRARCAEASEGGRDGYRHVGRHLMRTLVHGSEMPYGLTDEEFFAWLAEFRAMLCGDSPICELTKDQSFAIWRRFCAMFPKFAKRIPLRKRAAFVVGLREMSEEEA